MNFRQVHIDFHTSEAIKGIGKRFDKEQFKEALRVGHVNAVTLFAKCHHGWSYYPSEVNPMHPELDFDLLGAQLEAAAELGVSTSIYVSAGLDEKTAREHPEWLIRDANEKTTWATSFSVPGYHRICMNSPYLDELCKQITEVCKKYKTNGIFLDIVGVHKCYCQNCVRILRSEGKDPYDEENARELAKRTYLKYARRTREAIDEVDPSLTIFHNAGHVSRGNKELEFLNSHLELEALPTGGWGYDYFPQSARYFNRHDIEMLGMTGKFHTAWGEFGGFKHPNALRYEVSLNAALGAKSSIGDQLHPSGEMDMATYRLIGEAYSELEAKEPWLRGAEAIADIAVLSNEAVGGALSGDNGAVRILHEGHYLFDFIDTESPLDRYKVVVLPECPRMTDTFAAKLRKFCDGDGKVLATGQSALLENEALIPLDLGAKWQGEQTEYSVAYMHPIADNEYFDDTGYVFYSGAQVASPTNEAAMLVRMERPYFERTVEHFCSHKHAPNSGELIGAAMTEGKDGIYIAANIFEEYVSVGSLLPKHAVLMALDRLLGDSKTVRAALPSQGKVMLSYQESESRYICHVLYASPILRGAHTEVIEDIVPLYNVELQIKLDKEVKNAYLAPSGEKIAFTQENGCVKLCVPRVECHAMIALDT